MNTQTLTPTPTTIRIEECDLQPDSCLFLDVRTPAEYEEIHIEGSVLHPITELNPEKIKTVAGSYQRCLVICRSGNRARQAAEKLAQAGLENICVLEGGILAWEKANRPVKRGRKTISLERQVRIAAGAFILTGAVLSLTVNPLWALLPAFVGAGLMFAGITDWCGLALILARMPWNNYNQTVSCCSARPAQSGNKS
jgi:rhodanese-related sulfurtransferase